MAARGTPEWRRQRHAQHVRRTYKLSAQEYDVLLARQGGRCAMPSCQATEPASRGSWSVDHDHETNEVRGLLCQRCNVALGFYERNKAREAEFEDYLSRRKAAA